MGEITVWTSLGGHQARAVVARPDGLAPSGPSISNRNNSWGRDHQ